MEVRNQRGPQLHDIRIAFDDRAYGALEHFLVKTKLDAQQIDKRSCARSLDHYGKTNALNVGSGWRRASGFGADTVPDLRCNLHPPNIAALKQALRWNRGLNEAPIRP
jgi:hypothetical protein